MSLVIRRGVYVLLFFMCTAVVSGQRVRLYSSEDGLPNSQINKVYQDNRGYIWIATENGLSSFDGLRFTTFHHDRNRSGTIASDLTTVIFTDSRGVCWIGTSNGLQIFDYEFNTFHDFPLATGSATGNYFISSICESRSRDKLIVAVSGRALVALDARTHERDTALSNLFNRLLQNEFPGKSYIDSQDRLWIYSERGFSRLTPEKQEVTHLLWGSGLQPKPKHITVSAVMEEPLTGNLLIGTYNHGLYVYDQSLGYIRPARGRSASDCRVRDLLPVTVSEPSQGVEIWVGTEDSGVKKFNTASEEIEPLPVHHSPIDLSACKAHSLMQDSQGNVWVGIYQKGLMMIPRSTYGFEHYAFTRDGNPRGENLACVTSVVRDPEGDLWAGTDGGGLFRIGSSGRIERYTERNTPLHNNSIMTLILDKRGTMWISTYMGGITTYHPSHGFRAFSDEPDLQKVVASVYDKQADKLYFATHGQGISELSILEKTLKRIPNSNISGWISTICLDSSDRLWVGRIDGMRCYNTKTWDERSNRAIEKTGLTRSYSLLEGHDGCLWIGSADGLIRYRPNTEDYELFTVENGLPSNLVYTIQQDETGILWLGTGHGLCRFDPLTLSCRNFYFSDGLQENEFRYGAIHSDADGKMFIGGINGLSAFYPRVVDRWEQPMPHINFSRLTVLNEPIEYDKSLGKANILDRHISQARHITLKKEQNVFSLEFSVLEYTNPQKMIYAYRMEGFDPDWIYTESGHRSATYTNLPDGRYLFRVKAHFDGRFDEANVVYNEIDIHILPPWYKTWWAWLIYAALFGASVWLFIGFLHRRRLRLQNRIELEKKEMKLRMFTDMSHEIRTPLTLVMTPLKAMRETESDAKRKDIYNLMYRNVLRILRLINQLMDMRKIDNQQLKLRFNPTDMIFFVRDIMKSFEQLVVLRNIDYQIVSTRESLEVWIDQGNFDKVVFNILSNAFKYTPDNGYVLVTVETMLNNRQSGLPVEATGFVELRIENSGSFIPEEERDRIFERFYQLNDSQSGGSGIGLHLAKRIVELHHGTLNAEEVENGVAFVIRLPLGNAHLSEEEKALTAKHKDLYYSIRPDARMPSESEYIELPGQPDTVEVSDTRLLKHTVFVVDDDADLVHYLSLELSDEYNVEGFLSGDEAWERILAKAPDAVIADLRMPGTDGVALCRKIRKNRKTDHVPVVMLTSETDEESERLCVQSGVDRYLTKPVSLELLRSAVAGTIQTRERLRTKYQIPVNMDYNQVEMVSVDSHFVTRVIECIRKNLENPEFGVDDLSREVGISRVHLNRKLKENINISPGNLIKSIRLKQAAYLLIRHKVNISEVAYRIGFSTPAYFSNSFKEYFGLTPKDFVAKHMESGDLESLHKLTDIPMD